MLTGNKGEWSELYVFLKLLATGKLYAADAALNKIPDIYYPILQIIRQNNDYSRTYSRETTVQILDGETGHKLYEAPFNEFEHQAQYLLSEIKTAQGSSFSVTLIEDFLHKIGIKSIAAPSTDKSDIHLVVYDANTQRTPLLGFSIKSMLGKNSTLFNAGQTTNFIYELIGDSKIDIEAINSIEASPKIANRIQLIEESGFKLVFSDIQSKTLKLNLQLIDSDLPKILAEVLYIKFSKGGTSTLQDCLQHLIRNNPLEYDLSENHPFYTYKIKNFLTDIALGMTPSTIWSGHYDATGGIIIVKEDGDIVCYHIYNRSQFQEYLLSHTKLEQSSSTRYQYGSVYENEGRFFIKLNLQIRFI